MKIERYQPKYKQAFIDLNKEWLSEMFVIEPEDVSMFENLDELIDQGAEIFFAIDDSGVALSCCMLAPLSNGEAGIHLYRKNGFTEIPVDRNLFPFERANIAFEKILRK